MTLRNSFFGKSALLGMSALACAAFVSAAPASARTRGQNMTPLAASQAVGGQSVAAQDQATARLNARGERIVAREDMPQKLTFQIALVTLSGWKGEIKDALAKVPEGAGFQQVATYLTNALPKSVAAVVPPSGIVTSWNGHMVADIVFLERIPYLSAAGNMADNLYIGQGEIGGCQRSGLPLVVNGVTMSSPACNALWQAADVPKNDNNRVIGGNFANFGTRLHIDITNDEMPGNKIGGRAQVINIAPVKFEKIQRDDLTVVLPIKTANTMDREFIAPKNAATVLALPYNERTKTRLAIVIQPNSVR